MHRGSHSKRDRAPVWAVNLLLTVIVCGVVWVAVVICFL